MKITQGGYKLLKQMVSLAGWAKTVSDIYLGGQVLVDVLSADYQDEKEMDNEVEISLSLKQSQACIKAVKHFIGEGVLPVGKHTLSILNALELKPDES